MTEFDITVNALRKEGLNSDEILEVLSKLFQKSEKLNQEDRTVDEKIKELFKEFGIPNNIRGYDYCITAIKVFKEKGNVPFSRVIYPEVARIHNTEPDNVERTIRTAVTIMADRCPQEIFLKVFGNTIAPRRGIPTPTEFISTLAANV